MQNKIKELRVSKNMNQNDLAKALGYSQQTISRIENDKSIPDIRTIVVIADYFDVSIDYLVCRSNIKNIIFDKDEIQDWIVEFYDILKIAQGMNKKNKRLLLSIAESISSFD